VQKTYKRPRKSDQLFTTNNRRGNPHGNVPSGKGGSKGNDRGRRRAQKRGRWGGGPSRIILPGNSAGRVRSIRRGMEEKGTPQKNTGKNRTRQKNRPVYKTETGCGCGSRFGKKTVLRKKPHNMRTAAKSGWSKEKKKGIYLKGHTKNGTMSANGSCNGAGPRKERTELYPNPANRKGKEKMSPEGDRL